MILMKGNIGNLELKKIIRWSNIINSPIYFKVEETPIKKTTLEILKSLLKEVIFIVKLEEISIEKYRNIKAIQELKLPIITQEGEANQKDIKVIERLELELDGKSLYSNKELNKYNIPLTVSTINEILDKEYTYTVPYLEQLVKMKIDKTGVSVGNVKYSINNISEAFKFYLEQKRIAVEMLVSSVNIEEFELSFDVPFIMGNIIPAKTVIEFKEEVVNWLVGLSLRNIIDSNLPTDIYKTLRRCNFTPITNIEEMRTISNKRDLYKLIEKEDK